MQPAGPGASQVTLYYTGPGAPQSQALATFSVASDFSQWTRLGLSVTESQVSLYFNCELAGTTSVTRSPPQLSFDPNSTLYVGQAGPLVGTPLDVSTSLIWFMVYLYMKQLYIRQFILFSYRNKTSYDTMYSRNRISAELLILFKRDHNNFTISSEFLRRYLFTSSLTSSKK